MDSFPTVKRFFQNKSVLITGATGLVGKVSQYLYLHLILLLRISAYLRLNSAPNIHSIVHSVGMSGVC